MTREDIKTMQRLDVLLDLTNQYTTGQVDRETASKKAFDEIVKMKSRELQLTYDKVPNKKCPSLISWRSRAKGA